MLDEVNTGSKQEGESKKMGPARRLQRPAHTTKEQRYGAVFWVWRPQKRQFENYVLPRVRSIPQKLQCHLQLLRYAVLVSCVMQITSRK